MSPAKATMRRTGASSLLCSAVLAAGMPCATFHRHDSIGNWCGSKSARAARNDAALWAVAVPRFNPPRAACLGVAFEGHITVAIGGDEALDHCPGRRRRAWRQVARQRDVGPAAAVARDDLRWLRRRVAHDLDQMHVPGDKRVDV